MRQARELEGPRSTPLDKAVADYLFDTLHFKDLRAIYVSNPQAVADLIKAVASDSDK
jgi:hypothetical protein